MINIKPNEIELVKQWLTSSNIEVCQEMRIKMEYFNIINSTRFNFKFTKKGKIILRHLKENKVNYYTGSGKIDNTFYPRFLD